MRLLVLQALESEGQVVVQRQLLVVRGNEDALEHRLLIAFEFVQGQQLFEELVEFDRDERDGRVGETFNGSPPL